MSASSQNKTVLIFFFPILINIDIYKKDVGTDLLPVPRTEALAIARYCQG